MTMVLRSACSASSSVHQRTLRIGRLSPRHRPSLRPTPVTHRTPIESCNTTVLTWLRRQSTRTETGDLKLTAKTSLHRPVLSTQRSKTGCGKQVPSLRPHLTRSVHFSYL